MKERLAAVEVPEPEVPIEWQTPGTEKDWKKFSKARTEKVVTLRKQSIRSWHQAAAASKKADAAARGGDNALAKRWGGVAASWEAAANLWIDTTEALSRAGRELLLGSDAKRKENLIIAKQKETEALTATAAAEAKEKSMT